MGADFGATIILGPTRSRITGQFPRQKLYDTLAYRPEGFQFSEKFKAGTWDGWTRLYDRQDRFPAGLIGRVLDLLEDERIPVSFDRSKLPPTPPLTPWLAPPALRPYQDDAVTAALYARRGIVQVPCGGGKTRIAAGIMARLGVPAVIIVPTKDLLYQTAHQIAAFDVDPWILGDGKFGPLNFPRPDQTEPSDNGGAGILVATMQSAAMVLNTDYEAPDDEARGDDAPPADYAAAQTWLRERCHVLLIDECQHASCKTMRGIARAVEQASWIIGLSATPWRDDGEDLVMEGVLGEVAYQISSSELIEGGYLVPAFIEFVPVPANPDADLTTYQTIYRSQVVENKARYQQTVDLFRTEGGSLTLILVKQISHARALQTWLPGSALLTGQESTTIRNNVIRAANAGQIRCVVATTLADEGLDLPALDTVILAGGGKASGRALQRVGRALRPFRGKREGMILDLVDPQAVFLDHARARKNAYKTEPAWEVVGLDLLATSTKQPIRA